MPPPSPLEHIAPTWQLQNAEMGMQSSFLKHELVKLLAKEKPLSSLLSAQRQFQGRGHTHLPKNCTELKSDAVPRHADSTLEMQPCLGTASDLNLVHLFGRLD